MATDSTTGKATTTTNTTTESSCTKTPTVGDLSKEKEDIHHNIIKSSSYQYMKALFLRFLLEHVVQFLLNVSFYCLFQSQDFFIASSFRMSLEISIVSNCFSMTLGLLKLSEH
jgi:hypothetical protein